MTSPVTEAGVGELVRDWRQRRRLSQQALSDLCGVSTRHLSFLETGKAQPSRGMIGQLSEALGVPLRAQREFYIAAGFVPPATELALDAPPLREINNAIEAILRGHEPYPALVIDGGWDLVAANDAAYALLGDVPPELLEPPVNVVRLSLDRQALGSRILNYQQWRRGILDRIRHEYAATRDLRLGALLAEFDDPPSRAREDDPPRHPEIVLTMRVRVGDADLAFLTATTVFGTPRDVTVAELAIEALYPADDATRHHLTG